VGRASTPSPLDYAGAETRGGFKGGAKPSTSFYGHEGPPGTVKDALGDPALGQGRPIRPRPRSGRLGHGGAGRSCGSNPLHLTILPSNP